MTTANGKKTAGKNRVAEAVGSDALVHIEPREFCVAMFRIRGTTPYVQHRFSDAKMDAMVRKQEEGTQVGKKRIFAPKDFSRECHEAAYFTPDGRPAIPTKHFWNAIANNRLSGVAMTVARRVFRVLPDTFDATGEPLIVLHPFEGRPYTQWRTKVRLESGVADIRVRPMYAPGWECDLRIRYSPQVIRLESVVEAVKLAGESEGIGEARPPTGYCMGCFEIVS